MKEFSIQTKLMGSAFQLAVVIADEIKAQELLTAGINEIKRIENLLSEFLEDSQTTFINQNAFFHPTNIDAECFDLIKRCLDISALTNGCFDISVSPLKKLYNFKNQDFKMPSKQLVNQTLENIGYKKIILNPINKSIQFAVENLKISFAAVGKGYASDMVKKMWLKEGVTSGYINASGDLNAFGVSATGFPWKIGIANPDDKNNILLYVPLSNASVATSGDYEQFFIHKNKRYSHNINPHTGFPMTGIKSVTVFSPSAELSDALATAVYVKGVNKGIEFVNQLPFTHTIIIDDKNKLHFSKNLQYETVQN